MKWRVGARLLACFFLLRCAAPALAQSSRDPVDREIAITFDDLPAVSVSKGDPVALAAFTERLFANITAHAEPVVGFVNEALSQSLFGRPIRHVLLLHVNELNADHSGRLFERLKQRGYRFVTVERALEDPAYASADTYVGRWGISWMHHWELALGRPRTGSPDPPAWLTDAYEKGRR